MNTSALVKDCFLERNFFKDADALWAQLESTLTVARNGSGPLTRVEVPGAYTFLMTTPDRVFKQDLVLSFLNDLRQWGKEKVGARHASTPQIHVYIDRCQHELARDATRARWHYLYSLARNKAAIVRLLAEGSVRKKTFPISLNRVTNFQLQFNQFLVHETCQAYALQGPRRTTQPLEGAILFHGYLW